MNKILVTGNLGFVGKKMSYCLVSSNYNDISGYDLKNGEDIRNKFQLEQFFEAERPNIVINLAALTSVGMSEAYPNECFLTNVIGTKNLLDVSKKYGVEHFIHFSSSSVYGNQQPPNKETDEMNPTSVYGMSKAVGEWLVKNSGVPYTIIRPFNIYGENGRKDSVFGKWITAIKQNKLLRVYIHGGDSKRGYVYVGDLIKGVLKLIEKGATNKVYNLGGQEIIDIIDLVELFKKYTDKFVYEKAPKEDISRNWADISEAKRDLEFNPTTNFREKLSAILKQELQ